MAMEGPGELFPQPDLALVEETEIPAGLSTWALSAASELRSIAAAHFG
jgi:hypothetical protein